MNNKSIYIISTCIKTIDVKSIEIFVKKNNIYYIEESFKNSDKLNLISTTSIPK